MIIVSQDKDVIVNFDTITKLWIQNPLENDDGEFTIIAENEWISERLGYYKIEERAKKVLQEIIRKAEDLSWANLMDNLQIAIHDKNFGGALSNTYYMPEE